MWTLSELVERYVALIGDFGQPLPLSKFPLPADELTLLFNTFDEDYHISRYLHFSNLGGQSYHIDGEDATHLSIDASIKDIL